MEGIAWTLALLGFGTAAALGMVAVLQRRAAKRMADELRSPLDTRSPRVTVSSRLPSAVALGRAINDALERADERLAQAERDRHLVDEGLGLLSHDIRTPLAAAQGYLELYGREDGQERKGRCVACAHESLLAIRGLVDSLFEYSKNLLAAGEFGARGPRQRIGVPLAVESALLNHYATFEERGWEPELDLGDEALEILCMPEDFARICDNLTVNALRHGSGDVRVALRAFRLEFSNRVASPEAIDPARMFDRFWRADPSRTRSGSGLGLAIVRQLCQRASIGVAAHVEGDVLTVSLDLSRIVA